MDGGEHKQVLKEEGSPIGGMDRAYAATKSFSRFPLDSRSRVCYARPVSIKIGETRMRRGRSYNTMLRAIWRGMKGRCLNPKHRSYHRYGGRGINIYAEWIDSFAEFRDYIDRHLGDRPSLKYSLDRINNDGNYEPGNIKWSTAREQRNNNCINKLSIGDVESIDGLAQFDYLEYLLNSLYSDLSIARSCEKIK